MGKHSGRAALTKRLSDLGFKFDDAQINDVFIRFKKVGNPSAPGFTLDCVGLRQFRNNQVGSAAAYQ